MTIIVKPKFYDGSLFSRNTYLFCDTYLNIYTANKNVKLARAKKDISSGYIKGNERYRTYSEKFLRTKIFAILR